MMHRKGTRRASLALAASFVAVAGFTPAAQAATAPRVFCMQTFGHEVPAESCEINPNQLAPYDYSGKVYPNSILYLTSLGSHGSYASGATGSIYVEGNATPGSSVILTVSDGIRTLGPFSVPTAPTTDSLARAGDFFKEIMVSELGTHRATGATAVGAPDADLGPATLTVRAYALNGDGAGAVLQDTIVKHAATANDTFKPKLSSQAWPPVDVEHGCNGRWVPDALDQMGLGFFTKSPCPYFPIAGTIKDLDSTTLGTTSEISDVRITIRKVEANETYLDVRHSTANLQAPRGPILTRTSSNVSRYNYILNIRDLPTNELATIGLDETYTITVTVCDAWGDVMAPNATNCVTSSKGDYIVHSY